MAIVIRGNGTLLPSPDAITAADEIIWSANTGRIDSGTMIGTVIAEKKTFDIEWGVLTVEEYAIIKSALLSGFHPFSITIDGETSTISSYRGTLTAPLLGTFGGVTYYKGVTVSIVQQ